MFKFYTTGYTDKKINNLIPLLDSLDANLVDIRFNTVSKEHQWHGNYLNALLKNHYRHVQQLGNRSKNDDKFEIQNLELGIRTIISFEMNLVLMCSCKDLHKCHRLLVMNELLKKGYEVQEIEDWNLLLNQSI